MRTEEARALVELDETLLALEDAASKLFEAVHSLPAKVEDRARERCLEQIEEAKEFCRDVGRALVRLEKMWQPGD